MTTYRPAMSKPWESPGFSRGGAVNAREQWLEARRAGLGGSDIAAIFGLSRWKTPRRHAGCTGEASALAAQIPDADKEQARAAYRKKADAIRRQEEAAHAAAIEAAEAEERK